MKRWWVWPVVGLAVVLLGWLGAVLYVTLSARRQVEILRVGYSEPGRLEDLAFSKKFIEASSAIPISGCRALPALVAELDPKASPRFLQVASSWTLAAIFQSHYFERGTPQASKVRERFSALAISTDDSVEERTRKCSEFRRWWAEEGGSYHHFWRFWSTACRAPLSEDF